MAQRRLSLFFFSCLLLGSVRAAELGEPRVSSYRGQPLVADIELGAVDEPNASVQARVANADVYRGASLGLPPVLPYLNINVVRRDGRQFIHVTSTKPVDSEMLHLFLELSDGGRRDVRLATLWLAQDTRPAPVAAPVPVPAPVAAPEPAPRPRVLAALPAPVTTLPPVVRAPAPVACRPHAQDNTCAVLDTKNAALRAKLAGLETKIKVLESSLAVAAVKPVPVKPEAKPSAAAPVKVEAVKPTLIPAVKLPPAPVAVLVKPKKTKAAARAPSATPWGWIAVAAGVALLAAGAIVALLLLRRRRRLAAAALAAAPPGPPVMAGVKNRLLPEEDAMGEPV